MSERSVAQLFWQRFPTLQHYADRSKADPVAWAIEEILQEYLDRLAGAPELPPLTAEEVEALPQEFWERVNNRKKKHCRRREIQLKEFAYKAGRVVSDLPKPPASAIAEARNRPGKELTETDELAWVRSHVGEDEWGLIWALAAGGDYAALAKRLRVSFRQACKK
jgi:hypothetical protein